MSPRFPTSFQGPISIHFLPKGRKRRGGLGTRLLDSVFFSTSFPGSLSEKRETLVAAGHVPPRIWVVTKNSWKGGRLRLLLSILSLQESVKCCHQNKHFFHLAPVCCIKVMSQCNTVQTPKKIYQSSNNRNGGQNFVEEQPSLRFWFVTQIT